MREFASQYVTCDTVWVEVPNRHADDLLNYALTYDKLCNLSAIHTQNKASLLLSSLVSSRSVAGLRPVTVLKERTFCVISERVNQVTVSHRDLFYVFVHL